LRKVLTKTNQASNVSTSLE